MIDFLILTGVILCLTLSRKISMPLLGKITVWGFDLLFLLSSILNLGRIEALFFLIYALINVGVAIYLYHDIKVFGWWVLFTSLITYTIITPINFDRDGQRVLRLSALFVLTPHPSQQAAPPSPTEEKRAVFKQLILSIAIEWNL